MKRIAIGIIALTLTLGVTSCKEGKETEKITDETEHTDDGSHDHGEHNDHANHDDTTLMVGKEIMVTMSAKSGLLLLICV